VVAEEAAVDVVDLVEAAVVVETLTEVTEEAVVDAEDVEEDSDNMCNKATKIKNRVPL
jgi:hypothetical protein